MAGQMLGRNKKPTLLLQSEVQVFQRHSPITTPLTLVNNDGLTTGRVRGSRIQDLLKRDHLRSNDLPDVPDMRMGALDGIQAQKQRHGALVPSQALLGVGAEALVLRGV